MNQEPLPAQGPVDVNVRGWLPIETAPKDGTRVLLSDGTSVSIGSWGNAFSSWGWSNESAPEPTDGPGAIPGYWTEPPTHWMPLPDAPNA
jgi:hypothetical protein